MSLPLRLLRARTTALYKWTKPMPSLAPSIVLPVGVHSRTSGLPCAALLFQTKDDAVVLNGMLPPPTSKNDVSRCVLLVVTMAAGSRRDSGS